MVLRVRTFRPTETGTIVKQHRQQACVCVCVCAPLKRVKLAFQRQRSAPQRAPQESFDNTAAKKGPKKRTKMH